MTGKESKWFEVAFNPDYVKIYAYTNDRAEREVENILGFLSLPKTAPFPTPRILDLACGWGRHAILLALAGYDVTGVDFSDSMLQLAYEGAAAAGVSVERIEESPDLRRAGIEGWPSDQAGRGRLKLVRADMRDLPFDDEFHHAINIFTSFGYFDTEAENLRVLRQVNKALILGGSFVLDVDNEYAFRTRVPLDQDLTVSVINEGSRPERVHKHEMLDETGRRRVVEYRFEDRSAIPAIHLECELYSVERIQTFLEKAGFEVTAIKGDLMGNKFSRTSERLVVVSRKRHSP